MDLSRRKAVSPIIATLLLIAITVAAGVLVYVFVTGLSSSLTRPGGNQLTDQLSLNAYNFQNEGFLTAYLQNTGTSPVTVSAVYFNGAPAKFFGSCGASIGTYTTTTTSTSTVTVTSESTTAQAAQSTCQLNVYDISGVTVGTSYQLKVVTSDGGLFAFNVVAGSFS